MPNIEIHGRHRLSSGTLRSKIFDLFRGKPYFDEIVVSICPESVQDGHMNEQAFLRVFNDTITYNDEILELLTTLGMDIEYCGLERFIPRKKGE